MLGLRRCDHRRALVRRVGGVRHEVRHGRRGKKRIRTGGIPAPAPASTAGDSGGVADASTSRAGPPYAEIVAARVPRRAGGEIGDAECRAVDRSSSASASASRSAGEPARRERTASEPGDGDPCGRDGAPAGAACAAGCWTRRASAIRRPATVG